MACLPDTAIEVIFQYGLCAMNLTIFSSVCRQWRTAGQEPMCWAGKTVFIEGAANITREQLSAWLPRWHSAERVHLTCSQMDLLPAPLTVPHAIVHLWQTERLSVRRVSWRERALEEHTTDHYREDVSISPLGFWNEISIAGSPWLVCLTVDRVPDEVRLMREQLDDEGVDFWAPITLGWTSARTFDDLADMCSISFRDASGHGRKLTDRIVHAQMFPDRVWKARQWAWVPSEMASRPHPPPLYRMGRDGAREALCAARLDRARGAIRLASAFDVAHSISMHGHTQPIAEEMRFFVALPDSRRIRRRLLSHPYRDFVELPVPFLASSFRPAAEV